MNLQHQRNFDVHAFIARHGNGAIANFKDRQIVYTQGDTSDSLFYILSGTVKSTLVSEFGKEALIPILGAGDFFGKGVSIRNYCET